MTEKQKQEIQTVCTGPWYKRIWIRKRALVVAQKSALECSFRQQESLNERLDDALAQQHSASELAKEYQASARQAIAEELVRKGHQLEAEKQLSERIEQVNSLQAKAAELGTDLLKSQVESEKLKAEVEKLNAVVERAQMALQQERTNHDKTKGQLVRNCKWIWLSHRLDNPPATGIRGLLAGLKNLGIILMLLIPAIASGALPPPVVGNAWSTNRPPRPVEGQDNLSVTNLGSGTNWQFFNVGPRTVACLSDVTNIASSFGGGGLTTNANQFLGVPLSIKTGPSITNFNGWGNATNHAAFWSDTLASPTSGNNMIADLAPSLSIGDPLYDQIAFTTVGAAGFQFDGTLTPPSFICLPNGSAQIGYPTVRWKELWISEDAYIGGRVEATQYVLTNQPGLDRTFLMYNTNGQGYTAFSSPTNQWLPTNRFFLFVTNPVAGQVLEIQSVSYANGVASIVLTNATDDSGGLTTNANQFGASAQLTLKSGLRVTNIASFGTLTNMGGGVAMIPEGLGAGDIGTIGQFYFRVFTERLQLVDVNGTGFDVGLHTPPLAASYDLLLPNAQGLGALTNNNNGDLGWYDLSAISGCCITTNSNQFDGAPLSIKAGVVITNATLHGTTTVIGPQTNASSLNVSDGHTNWIGAETKGTLFASSNLLVKAGWSISNAWVGGTVWWNQDNWTNLNATATLTNLATNIVESHTLTNLGDMVHVMWRIKLANTAANTNQFQIVYGSQTVLDTGLQPSSNSVCQADLWLTRTGNTAQHADARFEWGPGSGAPFAFTNTNIELVQTNGIDTIFQLRGASRRVGAMTNNWTRVWYDPAVR